MQEEDPTAVDPDELPDKPAIENMPPEDGVQPPTDQEENEAEALVEDLAPEEAEADPTVDNAEGEEQPHDPSTLDIADD